MTAAGWVPFESAVILDEVAGKPVVRSYGDVYAEYAAFRDGSMLIDRSARHRTLFRGTRAAELLTGLVTNDVQALQPGQGCYAAALTPKGKVVTDLRVHAIKPDVFLIDIPVRAGEGWMQLVRKFVNPRLAPYQDVSEQGRQIGLYGPSSVALLAAATMQDAQQLESLAPYAHVLLPASPDEQAMSPESTVLIARVPDLRLDGFELYGPEAALAAIWSRLVELGAVPGGLDAYEIARVEAGFPEWGVDMDDTTIPQEANLDEAHAISFTKGCYTGQEVVARVHFRGHVNKHLRGLSSDGDEPLPVGAELLDATGKVVGDIRSAVTSPRFGEIGLGMVRREVSPGEPLTVRAPDASGRATMVPVPFAAA